MITAGFLPGCTAVWHRAVLEMVRAGWWADLPGDTLWPPSIWLAIPAAVVTALAILTAATSRAGGFVVVLGVSAVGHPWLPLLLAPLGLAVRPWPVLRTLARSFGVALLIWTVVFLMTPVCATAPDLAPALGDVARRWWTTLGAAGVALVVIDLFVAHHSRRQQAAGLAVLLVAGAWLLRGPVIDVAAVWGATAAVLWWRAASGARQVLAWQTSTAARAGALVLIAVVPMLAIGPTIATRARAPGPRAVEAWAALDAAGSPAVLMASGGREDIATAIWRGGPSEAQRSLVVIPPEPERTAPYLATTAVFTWDRMARRMGMRGMLVVPVAPSGRSDFELWRVLAVEPCHALSPAWEEVGATVANGQFSGLFPVVEPLKGALLYLGSSRRLSPEPLDWPGDGPQGFESVTFDRDLTADAEALTQALTRDGLAPAPLASSRFVARVRFDRRSLSPETLGVRLGGVATTAWARLYAAQTPPPLRQPWLCHSSAGMSVTGYPGAPATVTIGIATPHAVGAGWHGAESGGDQPFRWTAEPEAELLFIADRPQSLVLSLDADPGTGDWGTANLRISLNGSEVQCRSGAPPCEWLLPAEAVRRGRNVITLQSVTVAAPAPDPRRLGLRVRAATLTGS